MAKEQEMLVEELAQFLSRLEGHPVTTTDAMRLTTQQLLESIFPVRCAAPPMPVAVLSSRAIGPAEGKSCLTEQ